MNNIMLTVEEVKARVDGGIAEDEHDAIFQCVDEGICTETEGAEVCSRLGIDLPEGLS